jgi:hypothetical protein
MTELQDIIDLVRAGLSDTEVKRVLHLRQSMKVPAFRAPEIAARIGGMETVTDVMNEIASVADVETAPPGYEWSFPLARLALATRGSKYAALNRRRGARECADAIRAVAKKRGHRDLVFIQRSLRDRSVKMTRRSDV